MPVDDFHVPEDWKGVEVAVDRVVSQSSDPFDPATLANVRDLVEACRDSCTVPETDKGFWSTICFSWEGLEIEVFQDRYEFYRFRQGQTDIEEFSHTPGAMVPARLVSYLSKRRSLRD